MCGIFQHHSRHFLTMTDAIFRLDSYVLNNVSNFLAIEVKKVLKWSAILVGSDMGTSLIFI
jgi:hypothetical protein